MDRLGAGSGEGQNNRRSRAVVVERRRASNQVRGSRDRAIDELNRPGRALP
jgi:hypothetical protein